MQENLLEALRLFDPAHAEWQRGLHFDPQMAQVYQQLAAMFLAD